MQIVMLKVLLGPEDPTAWKRLQAVERARDWVKKNPERAAETNRVWREKNSERHAENTLLWRKKNEKKCAEDRRDWRKKNPGKTTDYVRNWRKKNPNRNTENRRAWREKNRLLANMRGRIGGALKKITKGAGTRNLLGCTIPELRVHLEAFFVPGMTWENYGPVWHVDHKRPCSSFDFSDPAQQRECFHFTNLQPLFAGDNLRKNDSWGGV